MINVNEVTIEFCLENNLPAPSGKDLSSIGHYVRSSFNFLYIRKKGLRGHIEGTGLMRIKEDNLAMVVVGYPDDFKNELKAAVKSFYNEKKKRMEQDEALKKEAAMRALKPKRQRIPYKKPAYSGK